MKKEKWDPKVGDRVIVEGGMHGEGYVPYIGQPTKAEILKIDLDGRRFKIRLIEGTSMGLIGWVARRQCIPIVKRNRREFWLSQTNPGEAIAQANVYTSDPTLQKGWDPSWKVVHVREVKVRK